MPPPRTGMTAAPSTLAATPDSVAERPRAAPARRRDLLPVGAHRGLRVRVDAAGAGRRAAPRRRTDHPVPHRRPGSCWVAGDDGVRHWAHEGDVIVLPYGDRHIIGGDVGVGVRADHHAARSAAVGAPADDSLRRWRRPRRSRVRLPALRGSRCSTRRWRCSPRVRRASARRRAPRGWVRASVDYSLDENAPSSASASAITTRLPELVLIEVLRVHLATRACCGPRVRSPRSPTRCSRPRSRCCTARPNTSGPSRSSRRHAAVSRSLLDERFRQVLGRAPIRYLSEWRMHLAEDLLADTESGVADRRPPSRIRLRRGVQSRVQARARHRRRATGEWRARRTAAS